MDKNYELDELVIGSGGIFGVYMIGAIYELTKYHPLSKFKYYTGCSIGAIICLLINIGYNIESIKKIILEIDFGMFQEIKFVNFINDCGLDNGDKMMNFLKALILNKNIPFDITFEELYEKTKKTLTFTVSNITKGIVEYHNHILTPNMSILLSLKMSTNVPILYYPILYNNQYYVDGALLDPYPHFFNKNTKKIGIWVLKENDYQFLNNRECTFVDKLDNSISYIQSLLTILINNYYKKSMEKIFNKNSILIVAKTEYDMIDFHISYDIKVDMLKIGQKTFDKYYQKILKKKRIHYLSIKYYLLWKSKVFNLKN